MKEPDTNVEDKFSITEGGLVLKQIMERLAAALIIGPLLLWEKIEAYRRRADAG